jgi:hypothetical protein
VVSSESVVVLGPSNVTTNPVKDGNKNERQKNDDAFGTALKSNRTIIETETQSISLTFLALYNNKQWLAR